MATMDESGLLQLFADLMPAEKWEELEKEEKHPQIYSLRVVVRMMLLQRLQAPGTQRGAVAQLTVGDLEGWLPRSKRVREKRISVATGGFARACGRVPRVEMEKVCDVLLRQMSAYTPSPCGKERPLFLLDGTTLNLEHAPELLQAYPPGRNQYSEGHWGILQVVVLHDMNTGIPLRPAWGPMYGPEAVSEQELAVRALERAPAQSVIMGDRNFGIFYYAHAVVNSGREVIARLTEARAKALGASRILPQGEMPMRWEASRRDRSQHPDLPPEAYVAGRVIAVRPNGFRETLYLFTTLLDPAEEIVALYARRWSLELDIRSLKRTLGAHHLRSKSCAAAEKELLIAVVAYGLVRAFMAVAAGRAGVPPRRLSFTGCYGLLDIMSGKLCSINPARRKQAFERTLALMAQSKLPQRSKRRAYPRAVWGLPQSFPRRRRPSNSQETVATTGEEK